MSDLGMTVGLIKALAPEPEVDPEEIKQDVEDWLEDHPEATTTVEDGSITKAKLHADLAGDIEDLQSEVGTINGMIDPSEDVLLFTKTDTLPNTNQYWLMPTLTKNHTYRIVLSFDTNHLSLSNLKTATGQSGSYTVDTVTSQFAGNSWTAGKTLIYKPTVDYVKYLQLQFNSAYSGSYSATLSVYDYDAENQTTFGKIENKITDNKNAINDQKYIINVDRAHNLLPVSGYTMNKIIDTYGSIADSTGRVLSDYIELDPTQTHICNYTKTASVVYGNNDLTGNINTFERQRICFFDENKNVLMFTGDTNAVSKQIPQGAKYVRVVCVSEDCYKIAVLMYGNYQNQPIVRLVEHRTTQRHAYESPNSGFENFKMVMFGDSITHGSLSVSDDGVSYVDYANDELHSNIINVGFGATRMTYPTFTETGMFSFYNLCTCIVSEDDNVWDDLDEYAENSNTTYIPHLETLKAIDWNSVNAVGLLYGANDYTSNTPVGSSYNEDLSNYDGACAAGLKLLLTKYPHLQVLLLGPFDREITAGDTATMTDRAENTAGLLMSDYADSLENVVSRFHCPLVKTGKLFGINQYTVLTYAPDGTHPRANIAQKRLGHLFAEIIRTHLCPE